MREPRVPGTGRVLIEERAAWETVTERRLARVWRTSEPPAAPDAPKAPRAPAPAAPDPGRWARAGDHFR